MISKHSISTWILVVALLMPGLFFSCSIEDSPPDEGMTPGIKADVSETLEKMVLAFLQSWEPPFYPDSALALFTRTEDFSLVIDGWYEDKYEDWAAGIPEYMAHDANYFTSYKHEVEEIRTVPLSPESGVVTIVYVWDHVDREGAHGRTDGRATLVCRKEKDGWKIVHYHGSHRDLPSVE